MQIARTWQNSIGNMRLHCLLIYDSIRPQSRTLKIYYWTFYIATQSGWITNLAWSPNGQELATSNRDYKVQIWGVSTGKLIKILVGATGTATLDNDLQVAWSPDGTKIASGDKEPVIWDVSSGKVIATIKSAHPLVVNITWSPDSQRLVTISTTQDFGTQTKATLEIWRL